MSQLEETENPRDVAERDVFHLQRTIKLLEETPPEYLAARLPDLVLSAAALSRLVLVVRNRRAS